MDLIYKYFSNESEYAFRNLEENNICFSALETLNDPFEGVGSYLYDVEDEEKAYWESIGSDLPKLISKRISDDTRDVINFKYRVFCSSKKNDDPLMWAYYANSHQGFCVGYDQESIKNLSSYSGDVVYSEKMYPINEPNEETFRKLLFHKGIDWKNEKEYRAIYELSKEDVKYLPYQEFFSCNEDNGKIYVLNRDLQTNIPFTLCSDKYILKTCAPSVIYLGLRTPMDARKKLIEIAKRNDVSIYQMIQGQNHYRFTYNRLN